MNSEERRAVWNRRLMAHSNTCPKCKQDDYSCKTWEYLIHAYNTAKRV